MRPSNEFVQDVIRDSFGMVVQTSLLSGYEDWNFLVTDATGTRYVAKFSKPCPESIFLDAQIKMAQHMATSDIGALFPNEVPNQKSTHVTTVQEGQEMYDLRIISFLPGTLWKNLDAHSDELLFDLGSVLGAMDRTLVGFSHAGLHRDLEWDVANAMDCADDERYILEHEKRRIASYFLCQFQQQIIPIQHKLRKAYIHNDANDTNILVIGDRVTGLFDFGDAVHTHLINNLAIACTYAMMQQPDPLKAATRVVAGYHERYPVQDLELSALYYLIAGRLCISVIRSARQHSLESTNQLHYITEANAWDLLYKLIRINPVRAEESFRVAAQREPQISLDSTYGALEAKRRAHIGRNLSISYESHLKIVKGALQYLYDDKGNTYIDCVNNVSHVGHCHPTVVRAMQKQIGTLNTNTRYLHDGLTEYAARLTAKLPPSLSVCYFVNSGSEANDLAIRMSRNYTQQHDVIVLDHAYHGTSTLAIELSPYKFDGSGGRGKREYVHKAASPNQYRGEVRHGHPSGAGEAYANDVQRIVEALSGDGKRPAAFICETMLGVGGQIPLPAGYLRHAYEHVRAAGGVCVADEVQVGFGRAGDSFWGFELQGVVPDVVVLGKPIGNGHPLAAVVVTEKIAAAFDNGMEYFNTFGGNPVSMAAGLAVLDVIEQEELQRHARETGEHLMQMLRGMQPRYPAMGEVRGHGLFIGVEYVKDAVSLEPAVTELAAVVEKMRHRGFLLGIDGPLNNVLKIKPPLVFAKSNADSMVFHLNEVMSELYSE